MSKDLLADFKEDFFLLLEAGFIAVNSADEDSAVKLFSAAQLLRPESTFPKVGFGYMHMCKLELKQACSLFNEVITKEPHNEMAKTLLGVCLGMMPTDTSKGEKFLEEMSHSHDSGIKTLANTAKDFIDTFVKKGSTPMHTQPKSPRK